jgi:hypothetical protein
MGEEDEPEVEWLPAITLEKGMREEDEAGKRHDRCVGERRLRSLGSPRPARLR